LSAQRSGLKSLLGVKGYGALALTDFNDIPNDYLFSSILVTTTTTTQHLPETLTEGKTYVVEQRKIILSTGSERGFIKVHGINSGNKFDSYFFIRYRGDGSWGAWTKIGS